MHFAPVDAAAAAAAAAAAMDYATDYATDYVAAAGDELQPAGSRHKKVGESGNRRAGQQASRATGVADGPGTRDQAAHQDGLPDLSQAKDKGGTSLLSLTPR
jgi:hypothetical protein